MTRRLLAYIVVVLIVALQTTVAQNKTTPVPAQKKTITEKLAKLAEPWPNADVLNARRVDAEKRALFQGTEPLTFSIESDFSAVNKDRDPNSTKQFPAVLKIPQAGEPLSIPIKIGGRGHLRRMSQTCGFVPLRLEFPKDQVKGTPFEGNSATLKLVTHCQNTKESDQFILREYLTYRLSNIILPHSFRGRLASVTYLDTKNGKSQTRNAMLLEDDGDVARRMGGRKIDIERVTFSELLQDPLSRMMVFEFMIGNTDFSIFALHNVVMVQTPDSKLHPVPYDFDLSALVRPPYAIPDRRLNLKAITDRLHRGPCRTPEAMNSVLDVFRTKKNDILNEVNSLGLESAPKREVLTYLNDFFSLIERPGSVKHFLVDTCNKTAM